jgi:hypothetical protein
VHAEAGDRSRLTCANRRYARQSRSFGRHRKTRPNGLFWTAAWTLYERTASSRYPLQASLGHLGLALIQAERGQIPGHATTAARIVSQIGSQLIAARAQELLTKPQPPNALRQVFFC